ARSTRAPSRPGDGGSVTGPTAPMSALASARRKTLSLAVACCLLAAACAQLPNTALLMRSAPPNAVQLDGPDGPLSKQRSAARLAEIKRKSGAATGRRD